MADEGRPGLRVLYWTEAFFPYVGGTEALGRTLVTGLQRLGHELLVVTSHGDLDLPDEDEFEGIPVRRFPFQAAATSRDVFQLAEIRSQAAALKRSYAPDLIHVNAVGPSLLVQLQSARSQPIPWIFTPHAPLSNQDVGSDTILGQAFRSADRIACLSEAQRISIEQLIPGASDRTSVIYCGLEPPAGDPIPLPFDEPLLVCLGRHVRDKGFDVAVSAFSLLTERFPKLRLTIIGDGPARPDLEGQAEALGVADRVDFPGYVPEVAPIVNQATIVLMPSRWEETFGLVALEAALLGRPVVATRVGALPEVVLHGVTGLITDSEDAAGLAESTAALLEDPEATRRMGTAARDRALDKFGLARCLAGYDDLYRQLGDDRSD
jgi:glycogen(starch) synthase